MREGERETWKEGRGGRETGRKEERGMEVGEKGANGKADGNRRRRERKRVWEECKMLSMDRIL